MVTTSKWWTHPVMKKVCKICDNAWAVICMALVPGLVGGVAALLYQHSAPPVKNESGLMVVVGSVSTDLEIRNPVQVLQAEGPVKYNPEVVDLAGATVQDLDEHVARTEDTIWFKIKPLPEGSYLLRTRVAYELDSEQSVETSVNVARIEIF